MQKLAPDILTIAPPRVITVTITEEDRQAASAYCENGSCILATALQRMGYRTIDEGVHVAYIGIERVEYRHTKWGAGEACATTLSGAPKDTPKPHYTPEVVGKTIVLTRA